MIRNVNEENVDLILMEKAEYNVINGLTVDYERPPVKTPTSVKSKKQNYILCAVTISTISK